MRNLHGPFEHFTDIHHATRTPHLPSLTTDCCLVGIVIKCTFETSQRVWPRVKRKNGNEPVKRRTIITEHACVIQFW